MSRSRSIVIVSLLAACSLLASPTSDVRELVLEEAGSLIGTTEKTGHNDGPVIDAILATVGLAGTGSPYCAAFNRYSYDRAGLKYIGPRSAWSPDWVRNPTWTRATGGPTPLPADTWGIFWNGRVRHTGLVREWGKHAVVTIEGNTAPQAAAFTEADRNGDGIWSKRRLTSQIYAVRNWID